MKKLAREAKSKERDGGQDKGREGVDEVVVAGQVVNEELAAETAGRERWFEMEEGGGDELDEEQVKVGRKEEKDFMVDKLNMFQFGSYEEAVKRGGKAPTTTKWVEGWKADEEGGAVRQVQVGGKILQKERHRRKRRLVCSHGTIGV